MTTNNGSACFLVLGALAAVVSGCSGSDDEKPKGTVSEADQACAAIDLPAPNDGLQLKTVLKLEPSQEREVCQLVKLDRDLNLNWSEGYYTTGSHHAVIIRTEYKDSLPDTTLDDQHIDGTQIHDCQTPTALWKATEVIVGGRPVSHLGNDSFDPHVLPEDVAFKLVKGEYVLLNFHMLNTSQEPMTACYKANLHGIPQAQMKYEAGSIFWYNAFITVPARGESTARMACQVPGDIHLATSVSHAHKRLDGYTADLLSGDPEDAATTKVKRLYEGPEWDTPPVNVFKPALSVTKGQWIDYQCHFSNPDDVNIAQGFQTTDEMCMFIGAYWPKLEKFDRCGTFDGTYVSRVYGHGTKPGADFLPCLQGLDPAHTKYTGGGADTSADRYKTLSCVTDTCAKASANIGPMLSACTAGGSTDPKCQQAAASVMAATCD